MWLHELLKYLRATRGLSQYGCAKGVGLSSAPWRSIELGLVTPNLRTLARIAKFLGFKVIIACERVSYGLSLRAHDGKGDLIFLEAGKYASVDPRLNALLLDIRPSEVNQACLLLKTISDGRAAEPAKKTRKKKAL